MPPVEAHFALMSVASSSLMLQFLGWLEDSPRTYADVMEAWRSTCPRLSIWEDALNDGLVRRQNGNSMKESRVMLTDRGRVVLVRSGGQRRG